MPFSPSMTLHSAAQSGALVCSSVGSDVLGRCSRRSPHEQSGRLGRRSYRRSKGLHIEVETARTWSEAETRILPRRRLQPPCLLGSARCLLGSARCLLGSARRSARPQPQPQRAANQRSTRQVKKSAWIGWRRTCSSSCSLCQHTCNTTQQSPLEGRPRPSPLPAAQRQSLCGLVPIVLSPQRKLYCESCTAKAVLRKLYCESCSNTSGNQNPRG